MDAAGDKRKGENRKKRDTPFIPQPGDGNEICIMIENKATERRKAQGHDKPDREIGFCPCAVFFTNFHGNKFGYGSLDSGGGECKTNSGYWCDELINTQTFCTNGT